MNFTRFLFQVGRRKQQPFKELANEWIMSSWGRRAKIAILTATVSIYPIGYVIFNGPLLNRTFKRRYNVDEDVPEHLKALVIQEYNAWREKENRKPEDAIIKFYAQNQLDDIDTVGRGSMGTRFGGHLAFPLFARFQSTEEAEQYCKTKLEPLKILDQTVCILWESKFGKDLIDTFVLSPKALRFLISRDLYTRDGYQAFANMPISWASFTAFSSILTYWWHRAKWPTAWGFFILYVLFTGAAAYGAFEWHRLYRYMNAIHADSNASRLSAEHCVGGIEYYMKLLRRNQLLRDVLENGHQLFGKSGECFGVVTPYITRFGLLKDMRQEHSELAVVSEGDVFFDEDY